MTLTRASSTEIACHRATIPASTEGSPPQARMNARVVSRVGSFRPAAAVDRVLAAHPARRAIER